MGSGAGDRLREQAVLAVRDGAGYALDEARFSGRDFGLLLQYAEREQPGVLLRWRERLPAGWRPPERSAAVFEDLWLEGDVELLLDGLAVTPFDGAAGGETAGTVPQWQFLASGDTQTGELRWRDPQTGAQLWRLEWDALGRFSVFRGDELESLATAP